MTTGTGIGLALSRSLAELHQGTLAMGEGEENNTFCLTLPIVQDMTITLTPEPEAGMDKVSEISAGEVERKITVLQCWLWKIIRICLPL